jgi:hypothetical protein
MDYIVVHFDVGGFNSKVSGYTNDGWKIRDWRVASGDKVIVMFERTAPPAQSAAPSKQTRGPAVGKNAQGFPIDAQGRIVL